MAQTLSSFAEALKRKYIGPIRDQLNNATYLDSIIEENSDDVTGDALTAFIPTHMTRNYGIGARDVLGSLPVAGREGYVQAQVAMKYVYGRIQLAGQLFNASKTSDTAFIKAANAETIGVTTAAKIHQAKMSFGDASGALGRINQSSGSVTAGSTIGVDEPGVIWLEPGMKIVGFSAKTGGTQGFGGATVTVASVNRTTNTITLEETITITNNDFLFLEGERGLQIMGLRGIIDGGTTPLYVTTLQAISRTTYPQWKANVLDNPLGTGGTNRPLTLDLVQNAFEQSEIIGGKPCTHICSSYAARRRYLDLLVADRRYTPDLKLVGGFNLLAYTGGGQEVKWAADRFCPDSEIFFINRPSIQRYTASDWDWMDRDGAMLNRVAEKDAYEATLYRYYNNGADQPNANTVLRDISTTL